MPIFTYDTTKDHYILTISKIGDKWSKPMNIGDPINSTAEEYYISMTEEGSLYFSSNKNAYDEKKRNFQIYKADREDGKWKTPECSPKQ